MRREPAPVGRQAEVDRLSALVRQTVSGRGAVVVLDGEAGIGKTSLLDAVAAECGRLELHVFRGGAAALERYLPFAVIDGCLGITAGPHPDWVAADCDRVAALLRDVDAYAQTSAASNHEFVVTDGVLDLVDRWCARGPVALLVDDIQWADRASMVVLHRLSRSLAQQPLLVVLATWSTAHDETATELVRGLLTNGAQALTLGPLADSAVAQLVADRFGAAAGPGLLRVVAEAGGNPMFVGEMLAALDREGAIRIAGGVADVEAGTGFPVPRSLVEAVQRWLDFLPRGVRRVLSSAAILGPAVDVSELSMVLDMSVAALADAVGDAVAVGLLVDTGQGLMFRHGLIREALAAHQPQSVRTALRLRAGQVLAGAGAPVERVAGHLVAGTILDRNLVDWVAASADALTVRAPDLAVPLLRRALGTADGDQARMLRPHLVRALPVHGGQLAHRDNGSGSRAGHPAVAAAWRSHDNRQHAWAEEHVTTEGSGAGKGIRVFLVDDHAVVRRGMRAYFDMLDDIEVLGEAADGRAALDELAVLAARDGLPDVVLMDLVMPRLDGIAATTTIKRLYPDVEVVALTSFSEADRVHVALEAGAAGYLLKDAEADEMVAAVRAAHRVEVHLDPVVARNLTRSLIAPARTPMALTPREREILVLVAQGKSNRDIADTLVISERTARTHVSNVLSKLGLASRTQAALWAVREGLVSSP